MDLEKELERSIYFDSEPCTSGEREREAISQSQAEMVGIRSQRCEWDCYTFCGTASTK